MIENSWKPTDEQIKALEDLIAMVNDEWGIDEDSSLCAAFDLVEDLKKLKNM